MQYEYVYVNTLDLHVSICACMSVYEYAVLNNAKASTCGGLISGPHSLYMKACRDVFRCLRSSVYKPIHTCSQTPSHTHTLAHRLMTSEKTLVITLCSLKMIYQ